MISLPLFRLIRLYFMHYFFTFYGIRENAFTIAQNALIVQLLEGSE